MSPFNSCQAKNLNNFMPNFHNKDLFSDALRQVRRNETYIAETYKNISQKLPNHRQHQLNEIVGEVIAGLAAGSLMLAPGIAKFLGAREEKKRYEREQGFKETEAKENRRQELRLQRRGFRQQTSEREAGQGFQTSERLGTQAFGTSERLGQQAFGTSERLGKQAYGTSEREAGQGFQTSERLGKQAYGTSEREAGQGFQTSERLGKQAFGRGERLGTQRYGTAERREGEVARALEIAALRGAKTKKEEAKAKRAKKAKKAKKGKKKKPII